MAGAHPLMGVVLFELLALVAVVTAPTTAGCSMVQRNVLEVEAKVELLGVVVVKAVVVVLLLSVAVVFVRCN